MAGDPSTEIEVVVESVRVHMRTGRHVLLLKEVGAGRILPVWIGAVGGPGDRDAPPGDRGGAAADPRPVRHHAGRARCPGRSGGDRVARGRHLPRPARAGDPGHPGTRSTRVPRTRSRWRCGSSARSTPRRRSWTRRRPCPTATTTTRTARRAPRAAGPGRLTRGLARGDRRGARPHQARHLPRVREQPRPGRSAERGRHRLVGLTAPQSPRIGRPRRRARSAFAHRRSRSIQKSLTARQITDGRGAGRRARGARVVRDADLGDRAALLADLDQQLRREERAAGLDPDALEGLAPEQLAGAVDVADPEPEEDPVGELVGPGVHDPDQGVGALDPVAHHHVRAIVRREPGRQPAEVLDPELPVAVGEREQLVARGLEAGPERAAVAAVDVVVDDPDDARVLGGEPVRDLAGAVLRAVVHGDDLERLRDRRERLERLGDQPLEVGLLVVGREEVAQARHPLGRRDGAGGGGCGGHGAVSWLPVTRYTPEGRPTGSSR